MSNYAATSGDLVPDTGGSFRVTIASNVGRGNGGTSLPCKRVYITQTAGNTGQAKVNIGAAASATLGIDIPKGAAAPPVALLLDDASKLYFYSGTNGDTVDVLYTC